MTNAQNRRFAAIAAIVAQYIDESHQVVITESSRDDVARQIRETLLPLGRTSKWQNAVEQWATMIADRKNDIGWAFLQGNVWIIHAAS